MSWLAVLRFKLMLAWTSLMRIIFPYSMGNNLAALTIPFLHPGIIKHKPDFMLGLDKVFDDKNKAGKTWKRHESLVSVTRFQGSFYSREDTSWIKQCQLEIKGAECIEEFQGAEKGVLVMTYHHHLNMLFCNLLARLNFPVTTIAMDDRDNSRFQNFGSRINRIYRHAQKLLNGGEIILVKPQRLARPILRAFDKNHLVVTANDFPGVFDDKNRKDFPFLNATLSCPTGTVKLAVKKNIPIVAAYLDWLGGSRFEMVIKPVSDGIEAMDVNEAMARYLSVLEVAIENQPGLWEGWKWIK
jgi:lauroyl/myristoyl acyltransferase